MTSARRANGPRIPELLDWLAVEFRERGWDVKHMVKLLVMSSTYRQDSRPRPELREIDPDNRLLACADRRAGSRPSSSATTPWRSPG